MWGVHARAVYGLFLYICALDSRRQPADTLLLLLLLPLLKLLLLQWWRVCFVLRVP